jgi:hypothetical protein
MDSTVFSLWTALDPFTLSVKPTTNRKASIIKSIKLTFTPSDANACDLLLDYVHANTLLLHANASKFKRKILVLTFTFNCKHAFQHTSCILSVAVKVLLNNHIINLCTCWCFQSRSIAQAQSRSSFSTSTATPST